MDILLTTLPWLGITVTLTLFFTGLIYYTLIQRINAYKYIEDADVREKQMRQYGLWCIALIVIELILVTLVIHYGIVVFEILRQ